MNILITGAKGFVGKNLTENLRALKKYSIFEFDKDNQISLLDEYCKKADFVFHLAGVQRPKDESEFMEGNFGFTDTLLGLLKKHDNKATVLMTSSIWAAHDNAYGKSKLAGENLVFEYGRQTGAKVLVYRLSNLFGKWGQPNYASAVTTFCYNIANDLPIQIHSREKELSLIYIDDLIEEFINALSGNHHSDGQFCFVEKVHKKTLGEIADLLESFKCGRENFYIPNCNGFEKALYSTYLSYLPKSKFSYPLKVNADERGSFTEIIKTIGYGHFSVNASKAGITKGNHWHNTKNEKFLVVSGSALIRFRKIGTEEIIEYSVSGDKFEVVDIPVGYTHSIKNTGESELITFMWVNEPFDENAPDTFFEEV